MGEDVKSELDTQAELLVDTLREIYKIRGADLITLELDEGFKFIAQPVMNLTFVISGIKVCSLHLEGEESFTSSVELEGSDFEWDNLRQSAALSNFVQEVYEDYTAKLKAEAANKRLEALDRQYKKSLAELEGLKYLNKKLDSKKVYKQKRKSLWGWV